MGIVTKINRKVNREIIDEMLDFLVTLEPKMVTEDQALIISNIIEMLDPSINEGFFKVRKRRDLAKARERRREYRRNRASRKLKMKRYRKSAKGKAMLRKSKRLGAHGRTSTGKRKKTFIGPKLPKTLRR